MASIDPELFRYNAWGSFTAWLDSAQTNIVQFNQNRNVGILQNVNNALDDILSVLGSGTSDCSVKDIKALSDANSQFTEKIIQELELVRKRSHDVKMQFDTLSSAVVEAKNRIVETDKIIQEQKTRLDQSIATFQKQFSEAQEKRTKDFADLIKKSSDEFTDHEKTHHAEFKESSVQRKKEYEILFDDARKQCNAHFEFLKKREAEVNEIFGAIGTTAFAGNFKSTADTEANAANLWRWIALSLMAAMIGVGGYAFYFSIGHETDWRVFAFRLGTVIVLAVPAVYAANESSKHRERERQNRKTHLELASLDAYLVQLPENERNKIKGNLTDRFFGVAAFKEKTDEVTQKDLFGVLTTVLNNLTKGK